MAVAYRDNPDYPDSPFGGLDVAHYNANVPEGSSRVQAPLEEAIRNLRPEDLAAIVETANNLGMEPITLLAILHEESAGTMDPGIPMIDGRSSATGALQILTADKRKEDGGGPGVAETIGVPGNTWRERRKSLQNMSLAEYMGYVQEYFEQPYVGWMDLSPEEKSGIDGAIRAYQGVHAGKVGATATEEGDDGKKTEDVFPAIENRYNALSEMDLDLTADAGPPTAAQVQRELLEGTGYKNWQEAQEAGEAMWELVARKVLAADRERVAWEQMQPGSPDIDPEAAKGPGPTGEEQRGPRMPVVTPAMDSEGNEIPNVNILMFPQPDGTPWATMEEAEENGAVLRAPAEGYVWANNIEGDHSVEPAEWSRPAEGLIEVTEEDGSSYYMPDHYAGYKFSGDADNDDDLSVQRFDEDPISYSAAALGQSSQAEAEAPEVVAPEEAATEGAAEEALLEAEDAPEGQDIDEGELEDELAGVPPEAKTDASASIQYLLRNRSEFPEFNKAFRAASQNYYRSRRTAATEKIAIALGGPQAVPSVLALRREREGAGREGLQRLYAERDRLIAERARVNELNVALEEGKSSRAMDFLVAKTRSDTDIANSIRTSEADKNQAIHRARAAVSLKKAEQAGALHADLQAEAMELGIAEEAQFEQDTLMRGVEKVQDAINASQGREMSAGDYNDLVLDLITDDALDTPELAAAYVGQIAALVEPDPAIQSTTGQQKIPVTGEGIKGGLTAASSRRCGEPAEEDRASYEQSLRLRADLAEANQNRINYYIDARTDAEDFTDPADLTLEDRVSESSTLRLGDFDPEEGNAALAREIAGASMKDAQGNSVTYGNVGDYDAALKLLDQTIERGAMTSQERAAADFRATPEGEKVIRGLMEQHGLSEAEAMEMAVKSVGRKAVKQEGRAATRTLRRQVRTGEEPAETGGGLPPEEKEMPEYRVPLGVEGGTAEEGAPPAPPAAVTATEEAPAPDPEEVAAAEEEAAIVPGSDYQTPQQRLAMQTPAGYGEEKASARKNLVLEAMRKGNLLTESTKRSGFGDE